MPRKPDPYREFQIEKKRLREKAYAILKAEMDWEHITKSNKCEICGLECKPHAHHEDYNKPLEVEWVCHQCHFRIMHEKKQTPPELRDKAIRRRKNGEALREAFGDDETW